MLIKKEIHIFKPTYLNHNHMPKVFYKTLFFFEKNNNQIFYQKKCFLYIR